MTSSEAAPTTTPIDRPALREFTDRLEFALDPFQIESCAALEDGHGVLVCAPTGAGKTIVGEFAVHLALAAGTKCFYTTPIKALSNQKFSDLVAVHGAENIGLLTGDSSINPSAPVVVMTTEVVRNMIYANSPALNGLSHVVMDEVHFLADRFRGAVWEEVILHLEPSVKVVSLSATVSNAEEFGDWIKTVRGDTTVVVDDHRPIPLWQHMMVGNRIFDLFERTPRNGERPQVNSELTRYIKQREMVSDHESPHGRRGRGGPPRRGRPAGTISRPDLIARLDRDGLLPAIGFIFSRAGCEAALDQCVRSGLSLLQPAQAAQVEEVVNRYVGDLTEADQDVLNVDTWRAGLMRGLAAHHAGMLPAFRHAVEELFVRGLVRAVFATETLALGINMPARSVVLERLVKYNGEAHVDLTPGEFTQLTGRAGRRGIDVEGHAVVVWMPELDPTRVAGLAGARTFPLRSSFAPEYNMAINLIGRLGLDGAKNLLERSFAQFQTDRSVVGQHRKIDTARRTLGKIDVELAGRASSVGVEPGDLATTEDAAADDHTPTDDYDGFLGYMRLREVIRTRERELKFEKRMTAQANTVDELSALKRGHVIALHGGRHRGLAVVIEPATERRDPKPMVLCEDAWCGRVGTADFLNPPEVLGNMRLPRQVDRRTGRGRRDLASSLRATGIDVPRGRQSRRSPAADDRELGLLRSRLRAHPAHQLPAGDELFRLAERRNRVEREVLALTESVSTRTSTLSITFDRIVGVLTELGYLVDGPDGVVVTDSGRTLSRVYSESDLLICECIRAQVWDALTPPELAAVVSAVVYESRRDSYSGPDLVTGHREVRDALQDTHRAWRTLAHLESRHNVGVTREPDAGFATAMYTWASGRSLAEALAAAGERGRPLPAGDFVRWSRQVIDLLEQIRMSAGGEGRLARSAKSAVGCIKRGVVAVELG
ncbi:DEAD/DEAH box helicase [Williamsia phyllosphaerae]|uniref:ATP-dependent DNA helicase HelY n=1 Tax=Williamsia phyllosphaerae TaxID=885042 RepID=A0ABQ1V7D8_9NOCA|nr:DEAD/DEAH box helicase [Williamsia phyllosphaerae]GGF42561.1 putative ATP-dependent DNA helicase HelY [Williamsia phyllosphaerae]